jgi:hypothetical protein
MAVACRTVCGEDEALICEMRAGVVPSPNAVGAGKPGRVFALIGQVARLCDDKGAAAKAESIFPRRQPALVRRGHRLHSR